MSSCGKCADDHLTDATSDGAETCEAASAGDTEPNRHWAKGRSLRWWCVHENRNADRIWPAYNPCCVRALLASSLLVVVEVAASACASPSRAGFGLQQQRADLRSCCVCLCLCLSRSLDPTTHGEAVHVHTHTHNTMQQAANSNNNTIKACFIVFGRSLTFL